MDNNRLPYPTEILPRTDYIDKMDVDSLLSEYPKLLVARLVDGFIDDFYATTEGNKKTLSQTVFKNNMANLSFNLAGGLFDTDCNSHLKFLPSPELAKPWSGEEIDPCDYIGDGKYYIYDHCFGLCFFVNNIHNRTFPFHKHFNSKEERDIYESNVNKATTEEEKKYDANLVAAFESKKQNVLVRPRIKVHHSPTRANYWHMTLDTYRPTDKDYIHSTEKQSSSDKSMFKALKQDLVQYCLDNAKPEYEIDNRFYMK